MLSGNGAADKLIKDAKDLNSTTSLLTLVDANTIALYWLKEKIISVGQHICEIDDANTEITDNY